MHRNVGDGVFIYSELVILATIAVATLARLRRVLKVCALGCVLSACNQPEAETPLNVESTDARQAAAQVYIVNAAGRQGIDLSGDWRYVADPLREGLRDRVSSQYDLSKDVSDAAITPQTLKEYDFDTAPTLRVPGSWTAQVNELSWYQGVVWLRRKFQVEIDETRRYVMYFGAANYEATVFLNGQRVGAHRGGFTPFAFDVTETLVQGDNSLVVAVDAANDDTTVPPARTDWWNYGGLTRPVRLLELPATHVEDYWIRLAADQAIAASVELAGSARAGREVRIEIPDLGVDQSAVADGNGRMTMTIDPAKTIERWSPESPKLYRVLVHSGRETIEDRVGFRDIRVEGDEILLNGAPIFLRGISMHEETLGERPDRYLGTDDVRKQFTEIKDGLNGNFVRLAHYPHAEETLRVADEMGLLVWSEIPVYWDVAFDNDSVLQDARAMLRENILRDRNRASIIIWSVANETPIRDDRNRFLSTLIDDARALDPTRLVSLASNQNRQQQGVVLVDDPLAEQVDLLSVNYYGGWYGGQKLAEIPAVKWERRLQKPMIFSEFGAGALPGFSDPDVRRKFSEAYQVDYYRATIKMAKGIPFLHGASPWILKDFRSPRRFHPVYQEFWNRKGLLTPTGDRKPAFTELRAWYDEVEEQRP